MSEPDLHLCGLSIWMHGRASPEALDFWDRNWLILRATVDRGQSSVTTEGAMLMTTDFASFRDELGAMYETTSGEASLSGYEPNLKVTLSAERLGHIGIEVEITPDQMSEYHRFKDRLDQTYLPPLLAAYDAIIERFPVIGRPEN